MNFDEKWIRWISSFFNSAQLYVILNGSPTENFFMGKGIRHGDPISPMLFILAVESLKAIFTKAINLGLLSSVHIDGREEPILILHILSLVSTLTHPLSRAFGILGCKVEELPITYLGLLLSDRSVGIKLWDPIVANFSCQLLTWRGNLLSPAGRLTLIKSVLYSLPVYYLGSLRIPCSVDDSLKRIMRRFLWNDNVDTRGFSKVACVDVSVPLKDGCLNINPLRSRKICLLMKWMWKLIVSDRSYLWFVVVSTSSSLDSWFDIECLNDPLYTLFPSLFRLSRNKEDFFASVYDQKLQNFGNLCWNRTLQIEEQGQLARLESLLP
ncbi:uncharacterized protein LOC126661897 [Mercurialis annua]|uniref:uncharacterized protein LOC126661897 n=1 Tax=Mercurialis annua TaxID=3986 RepID=UPI00215EC6D1|nr:uncharacterized protein LOC126661897 [Mercurialis annua]